MQVYDFFTMYDVHSVQDLENALSIRHARDANSFGLFFESQAFPYLHILVKNELAYLTYVFSDGGDIYYSRGNISDQPAEKTTTFSVSKDEAEDVEVPNGSVVSFPTALVAAKEFFTRNELPSSIKWFDR